MKRDELYGQIEGLRDAADREGERNKDPHCVADRLRDYYLSLGPGDRREADKLIAEWAVSLDEKRRFDAISMIDEMKIVSARPTLELLSARLASESGPGVRFEMTKVARVIAALDAGDG